MQGYLQRILAGLGDHDPISVLEATPAHLELLFSSLGESDLDLSYETGKWTVRQIVAHLADSEMAMGWRLRQTVAEPGISIQPFDQDLWAGRYGRLEPSIALGAFRGLRSWNLAFLSTLSLEDWLAEAFHPERGFESVDLMVRLMAGHDLNHLEQLERIAGG